MKRKWKYININGGNMKISSEWRWMKTIVIFNEYWCVNERDEKTDGNDGRKTILSIDNGVKR